MVLNIPMATSDSAIHFVAIAYGGRHALSLYFDRVFRILRFLQCIPGAAQLSCQ
uniref:Uncharacterized protein n=1 Tax=Anguilla anguilla TaxID=7936 RepID=A0A0E9XRM3_ANGAN